MKGILVWGFFICFLLFFILMFPLYGKLKEKDNSVRTAWINMDRQYQYRNNMILNLVDMVGSELPQEKDVLQTTLAVHDRAAKVQVSMDNPTPEMLEAYLNVQDSVRYATL